MTSPESPAVQDTDRLREVAGSLITPEMVGAFFDEHHSAGIDVAAGLTGWAREKAQIRAGLIAALAAVLPVHREMVLRGAADYLDPGHRDPIPEAEMTSADWVRAAQRGAASNLRMWASPAFTHMWPATPPGSPPADERATAVETGRGWRRGVRELAVAPNVWVSFHGLDFAVAWHPVPGDSYRNVVKVIPHAKAPAGAVPGTGDDPPKRNTVKVRPPEDRKILLAAQRAAEDVAASFGYDYDDQIGSAAALSVFNAMRAERDRLALDLQARDIAVREADRLREQVEAERVQAVLALGEVRGREARLVAERDDARESAASILNDAGALAETIRKVREAAASWSTARPERRQGRALRWAAHTILVAIGDESPADDPQLLRRATRTPKRGTFEPTGSGPAHLEDPNAGLVPGYRDDARRRPLAALGDIPSPTAPAGRLVLLEEVLAVLRDDEGMWLWAEQFGPSRNACIVSISDRERLALYLTERFAPQGADTKETSTDD